MSLPESERSENQEMVSMSGGYFEFDDGGWYAGDWVNGQAYGYGKCTGPQGKGQYSGTWRAGFEVSGVYTWPNGHNYAGQWLEGKRGGMGIENKDNWVYKGEWVQGVKGKYGVKFNTSCEVKYEGSWLNGMQDGYGVETYIDESTYQGQWLRGVRHGFGVRKSAPKGISSIYHSEKTRNILKTASSLPSTLFPKNKMASSSSQDALYGSSPDNMRTEDTDRPKGGFVLIEKLKSSMPRPNSLQRSRSFSLSRSLTKRLKLMRSGSNNALQKMNSVQDDPFEGTNLRGSADTGKTCLVACSVDVNLACAVETYAGEWKNDKRCGYGVSDRSDGLKYEGEWLNDMRCGYGVTTYKNGMKEDGKYTNNELVATCDQKRRIFSKKKFIDRLDASVAFARKAAENAFQKAEISLSKRNVALGKAGLAEEIAKKANYLAEISRKHAKKFYIYYEGDNSIKEEVVPEKPKSKLTGCGSFSSWSDNYKTVTNAPMDSLADDVFVQHHQSRDVIRPNHPPTLIHNATQLSLQNTYGYSNKEKQYKKAQSLDRYNIGSDQFNLRHKSLKDTGNKFTKAPRKRNSTSKRDYLNGSPIELPDSLKPMPNGFIPFFKKELNNRHSSRLSLGSKSNDPTDASLNSHQQKYTSTNNDLLSQPSYLDASKNERAHLMRRRYSSIKHSKLPSYTINDDNKFQSIDMMNYKNKLNKEPAINLNYKSLYSNNEVLQKPSFRQKNVYSMDTHIDSILPNPYESIKRQNPMGYVPYEEVNVSANKETRSQVCSKWIKDNLIVIIIVLLTIIFSTIYFVIYQKDKK